MIGGEYDLRPGMPFPNANPLANPSGFVPRGDPVGFTPGGLIDPDAGRRNHPDFPDHGNDHHGMFNPDGRNMIITSC